MNYNTILISLFKNEKLIAMKNIYELDLHESTIMKTIIPEYENRIPQIIYYRITRVAGGWLYKKIGVDFPEVFIPYSEEFKSSKNINNNI